MPRLCRMHVISCGDSFSESKEFEVSTICHPLFKWVYFIIGITFNQMRSKWCTLFSFLVTLRLLSRIPTVLMRSPHFRSGRMIEDFARAGFFLHPFIEFVYLAYRIPALNRAFKLYFDQLKMTMREFSRLIALVRRDNVLCLILIVAGQLIIFLFGIPDAIARYEAQKQAAPDEPSQGLLISALIRCAGYFCECFIKNYIPLSVSLYLFYYRLLIAVKQRVLSQMQHASCRKSIIQQLMRLEDFINLFESVLSPLPFNWFAYNIGPGLCYLLSLLKPINPNDRLSPWQRNLFTSMVLCNFIFTTLAILQICRWQETLNIQVNSFTWMIDENSPGDNSRLIYRINHVLKRKVSVWNTYAIEKSLILSYTASALTFSVFFMQF